MGSCQIGLSVQNWTRGKNSKSAQNCTKILLHKDNFAGGDKISQR